jgi:hypothetical protein
MEVKGLFKRLGVEPHVIELDHLGSALFFLYSSLYLLAIAIGESCSIDSC